ncbi:MAG: amino acid permease [Pseudanabaenaceae cyanobacterium SKYGB_i_bin29]|nr:amino acid permease [Pseudanabaenaceae cyanobacterium SKYG29]MDW8421703.1 amino acid permease [Pseudanabaenaceae cyanobacterium SKYGB_i_bin29]
MAERKLKKIVRYGSVSADYLQRRQLRQGIGFWLLWGCGIGIVIDGIFAGWNEGLAYAGFWGMAIATALVAGMYMAITFSMAELSAALPHAGGFYAFTRTAFGAVGGFLCGIAELFEYVVINGWGLFYVGKFVHDVTGLPSLLVGSVDLTDMFLWIACTTFFTSLLIYSTELSLQVNLWIALLGIAMILLLVGGVLLTGKFDPQMLFTVPPNSARADASNFLPGGALGLLQAIPFAIWFYLAIEAMPITAEEAKDAQRDLPKAMVTAMVTLIVLSVLVLIFNPGIPLQVEEGGTILKGAAALAVSAEPMKQGLDFVFGTEGFLHSLIEVGNALAVFTGAPAVVFAYSRVFFALSRAGYLPQWISVTNERGIPTRGAILGGVLSVLVTFVFVLAGGEESTIGNSLVTISVIAALVTYILLLASYIKLQVDRPGMPRPYRSPVGILGAFLGLVLATIAFIACFTLETYRIAVYGTVIVFLLATAYFWFVGRKQLVAEAPEEQLAAVDDTTVAL